MTQNNSLDYWIAECMRLRTENAHLKEQIAGLLNKAKSSSIDFPGLVKKQSPIDAKVQLYKSLFKGRTDAYALRWEAKDGRSGYLPACAHEWDRPICQKPAIKCSECQKRTLLPLTDQVIIDHLNGEHIVGLYPMEKAGTCSFLAVDFDKQSWQKDVQAFTQVCKNLGLPYSVERSRSGNGAHIWFFFSEEVESAIARKFGYLLLTKTIELRHEIGMTSFDRMFPNQDTLPKGGFGNLIALPLQRQAAMHGNSLFIDENFNPYPDQWIYLSSVKKLAKSDLMIFINRMDSPVNVPSKPNEVLPRRLTIVIKNGFYIKKQFLPSSLLEKLMSLVSFKNPEYYRAQTKRLPTSAIPRVIKCYTEDRHHLILPRGCKADLEKLLKDSGIEFRYENNIYEGEPLETQFNGQLTSQQADAVSQLLLHENGVLSATTGFGKTVAAAALIAERKVNTLIIVDKTQLKQQWVSQLNSFLTLTEKDIGEVGGGKRRITGKVDVVTLQSLAYKGEIKSFITQYGQIIVDECHHISAFTFERVLKHLRARYVYGLTATPIRKDGLHPIIFMQCGPIRYKVDARNQAKVRPFVHKLIIRNTDFTSKSDNIQDLYKLLSKDEKRNQLLFDDVLNALEERRSPIILTERIEHLDFLRDKFKGFAKNIIVLSGNLTKKQQRAELERLAKTSDKEERLVIATGKYIGEGFDDARLDTLFLAMPISWKGTLQQYVGRLHRLHHNKQEVRVYDYVDKRVPLLDKMFTKRQSGYKTMGYVTAEESKNSNEQMKLF